MSDQNLLKSKAFSMRAIMGSPLSKILFEAIDASPGSTKKARARSILKSFTQSHQNYLMNKMAMDGQGGGGTVGLDMAGNLPLSGSSPLARYAPKGYTGQPLTLSPTGTVNPTTLPALTARPAPTATPLTLPTSPVPASPTSVSSFIDPTGSLGKIIPGVTSLPAIPVRTPVTTPVLKSPVPTATNTVKGYDVNNNNAVVYVQPGIHVPGVSLTPSSTLPAVPTVDQSKSVWTQGMADEDYRKRIASGESATSAIARVKELSSFTPTVTSATINPAKLTEDNAYSILDNLANTSGISELDTWYKSLSSTDQARLKVPYESVKAGEGPSAFSMKILSNKNLLGTVLGLPKEVVDNFPDTGLLSDQLNNLQDTVNKQFHLDEQLTNLTNLQNQGLTVKTDLQSYIRRKDEYLGKLDKMINDFDMKTAYMDTSDPNVAKRMDNYRNYLTILQGRQNMRYIDYLNTAIDDQNAKLTQATNLYNLSLTKAEQAFTRAERVTTESYNLIKGSLEDLYKNINDRTKIARDNETYQLDQMKAYYQLLKLIQDYNQAKIVPEGFWAMADKGKTELQQGESWQNVWDRIKMQFPTVVDETINKALGGSYDPITKKTTGWARPGAYQEWAKSKKITTGTTNESLVE